MPRIALCSSLLQAVTYQDQLALLEVELNNGAVYHYFCVPAQTYQELLQAESKGGYFNRNIRIRFTYIQIHPAKTTPVRDSDAFPLID